MAQTTVKATVINYFDVWGNSEDGYEVNNLCQESEIELPENFTNADILKALRESGFLRKGAGLNRINVEDLHPMYELTMKNPAGYPIGRIEIIED